MEEEWTRTGYKHTLPSLPSALDSGLMTNRGNRVGVGTSCRDTGGRVTRIFGLAACEATQIARTIRQLAITGDPLEFDTTCTGQADNIEASTDSRNERFVADDGLLLGIKPMYRYLD